MIESNDIDGNKPRATLTTALLRPLAGLVASALLLACAPSDFDPVAWEPPPDVGFTGPFEDTRDLAPIELLPLIDGHGPETIVAGPEGWLYTGLKGGRILRFKADGSGMEFFADTGGRVNGMAFDHAGNLVVVDSYEGLLSIDKQGNVEVLATGADGQRFVFNDGVDITADGTIWFTDATARYPDGEIHYEILEGRGTGRLLTYDPVSRRTEVRVADLRFPNGIALGPGDEYVLVNEMLAYRTLRHWITGPKAGLTEIFVESYPGLPDDIRFNDAGIFWVSLVSERLAVVDWVQPHPWLKRLIANAIGWAVPDSDSRLLGGPAFVIGVDLAGNVVHSLRDASNRYIASTSALEHDGRLFIGSISMNSIGVAPLPSTRAGSSPRVGP
jgi:sugar lactone lactonase YvrE